MKKKVKIVVQSSLKKWLGFNISGWPMPEAGGYV